MNDQTMMAPPGVADMVPQFGSRGRIVRLGCLAICAALLPGLLLGQTSQWSNGSGGTIYYNGGNVGIGTPSPAAPLTVIGNAYIGSADTWQTQFSLANSSSAADWQFLVGGSANYPGAAGVGGFAIQNGAWRFVINANGNVGIGTTSPQHPLHVVGTIGATEVIVSATGADYVFQPDYHLAPLNDVSAYITENHHLPDIPSAAEMQTNGISLGEMQVKLLAKVEELTLHMIELEQKNRDLEKTVMQMKEARVAADGTQPGQRGNDHD